MSGKRLFISGKRPGLLIFLLIMALMGGAFPGLVSGESEALKETGAQEYLETLLPPPDDLPLKAPENEEEMINGEFQVLKEETVGPVIELPQWSGFTGSEIKPGCFYETNSGIYLGISREDGFLVSYNNGITWEEKNNGLPRKTVYPFAEPKVRRITALGVDPVNNERVAVTTATGLYLSTDVGENWQRVKSIFDGGGLVTS
jgi:hypothetical protein